MRLVPVATLITAAMLTAACGGGDKPAEKPAEAPAAEAPAAEAPAPAPEAPAAAPAAEAAAPAAAVTYASLTGDAAKGEKVFAQCKACHVAEPGVNRVGPSLHGVVGRTAGTVAGFNYSKANKESGVTWNEDVLFTYLEAPQKFMPGTRMAFAGLKTPQDRADVIAYLKTKA
jgi:cytochrome c